MKTIKGPVVKDDPRDVVAIKLALIQARAAIRSLQQGLPLSAAVALENARALAAEAHRAMLGRATLTQEARAAQEGSK